MPGYPAALLLVRVDVDIGDWCGDHRGEQRALLLASHSARHRWLAAAFQAAPVAILAQAGFCCVICGQEEYADVHTANVMGALGFDPFLRRSKISKGILGDSAP